MIDTKFAEYARPIPNYHVNQWRYLPHFCDRHFYDLDKLGDITWYISYQNPLDHECDVDDCISPATWQEKYQSKVNFGESNGA